MMERDRIVTALGIALCVIGIAGLIIVGTMRSPYYLAWFSHQVPLGLGIALLARSRWLLTAETALGIIPESLWLVDFVGYLLSGQFIFGVTADLFSGAEPMPVAWWSYLHVLYVPCMLICLRLLGGASPWGWVGSLAHGAFLFLIPTLLITPDYNVNCVAASCVETFIPTTEYHSLVWWSVLALMVLLVNAALIFLPRAVSYLWREFRPSRGRAWRAR